jgi:hypothetical protein
LLAGHVGRQDRAGSRLKDVRSACSRSVKVYEIYDIFLKVAVTCPVNEDIDKLEFLNMDPIAYLRPAIIYSEAVAIFLKKNRRSE